MYKHQEPSSSLQVQYLKCTKTPHWDKRPKQKLKDTEMKKGSLTWMDMRFISSFEEGNSIHIEDNRYGMNFDPTCFRLVDKNGKTMGSPIAKTYIKPGRYRFKTREELIYNGSWDFVNKHPKGWNEKLNVYIGTEISKVDEDIITNKGGISEAFPGIPNTDYIISNTKPEPKVNYEEITKQFEEMPKFRIKNNSELDDLGLWERTLGVPKLWGNDQIVNDYLGLPLTKEFDELVDKGESFMIGDLEVKPEYCIEIDKSRLGKSEIEFYSKAKIHVLHETTKPKPEEKDPFIIDPAESMKQMEVIMEKVYDNTELRKSIVPLFIGDPGLGKTKIIEKFAERKGAKLVELITSQMSPFEISGIAMPDKDTKKMTYFNYDKIESLEDGDILFFDELLNGNPVVLNACLTILEQRRLISGSALPNVMIIAAANPQGMVPLTPQIKERFVWYNVGFSPQMWKKYMFDKYNMPAEISSKLCELIHDEELLNNNFYTPRSVDKAVSMIIKNCPTPYEPVLKPILSHIISNNSTEPMKVYGTTTINPGESMMWLDSIKEK